MIAVSAGARISKLYTCCNYFAIVLIVAEESEEKAVEFSGTRGIEKGEKRGDLAAVELVEVQRREGGQPGDEVANDGDSNNASVSEEGAGDDGGTEEPSVAARGDSNNASVSEEGAGDGGGAEEPSVAAR